MGGDLRLLPGTGGAHFLLTLAVDCPDQSPAPQPKPPSSAEVLGKDWASLRVLVVDDIATNRLVAKAHLRLYGVVTEEAASGAEAVEMIRLAPPDLVLLDMNMPGLDGTATLKRIRTLPSRAAKVPVIAMTADATEAHRRKYLDAGMDGYLAKPLTPEAVAEILSRFLGPSA
jgi:CheY-like chemotaxis protein